MNSIFDIDGKPLPLDEEIQIYKDVVEEVKKDNDLTDFSYGFII